MLNCGYSRHHRGTGGGTFSSAHEAAQSALQLIAGLNRKALEHDRGQPGDLLCIFGFAAQCVAFDRGVAAQFLQQSRKHGGLAPDSLEALVKRLRNLLTHRRAQRMGEVLVYGKSAQKQLFDMVSRSKTSLVSCPQPACVTSLYHVHVCGTLRVAPQVLPKAQCPGFIGAADVRLVVSAESETPRVALCQYTRCRVQQRRLAGLAYTHLR